MSNSETSDRVLTVDGLKVAFPRAGGGDFHAVDGVSFHLDRGETLGIVGESGSGKSVMALSLMGLVPSPGRIADGSIVLNDRAIEGLSERELCEVRGQDIAMVFQDPMTGLNPVRTIGSLLKEALRPKGLFSAEETRRQALATLKEVGLPSRKSRFRAYPHELSGGLRQRVMIALALINDPSVIIADEPTTALDATIQAQILALFRKRLARASLIMITHDLGVAAEICDRIAVMYHGRIVEMGTAAEILGRPRHPYTAGLLAAVPRFDFDRPQLVPIPGAPPGPDVRIDGCAFRNRCPHNREACAEDPRLREHDGRLVACVDPLAEGTA